MGLIRKAIVVGAALMAMPAPPESAQDHNGLSSWGYIAAAADTFADFKGFCVRKPQVCVTAQYVAGNLESKAKYSAKLVYEWANESTAEQPPHSNLPRNMANADPIKTSSTDPKLASAEKTIAPQRIEDLLPELRGTLQPEKG
jgi:Family of unknown function (DUF5330)